ncbi:hypothetical protein AVEN_134539-1 [Araneus ventricosus]|uniref:Uncharacterized protein n=1 Tax=Araneus ventricosus TaxID=182803 RepID=A0A4Y2UW03_ARAVE|nr:hypothetical protein AVEN_134539-1 [Araneus ventricosus]
MVSNGDCPTMGNLTCVRPNMYDGNLVEPAPQFQLHNILWVAVSSTAGLRVECRHQLQSVCLQEVVLVDETDENLLGLSLVGQRYSIYLTAQT